MPTIALESCSNPQKIWQVFVSTMKKNFLLWVSGFLWVMSWLELF